MISVSTGDAVPSAPEPIISSPLDDAKRIGIDVDQLLYTEQHSTANGMKNVARVILGRVRLGSIWVDNVAASVDQGELDKTLIGMSFLGQMDEILIRDNEMEIVLLNEMSL